MSIDVLPDSLECKLLVLLEQRTPLSERPQRPSTPRQPVLDFKPPSHPLSQDGFFWGISQQDPFPSPPPDRPRRTLYVSVSKTKETHPLSTGPCEAPNKTTWDKWESCQVLLDCMCLHPMGARGLPLQHTHTPLERLYLHPRRTFALVSVAIGGLEKASRVPRTKKTASVCISRTGWQEETIASKTAFVHPTGNPTEPMDLFSSLAEPDIEWRSFRFVWISSTGFGNGRGGQRLSGGSLAVMAWTPMRSLVKRKTMIGQDGMSLWDQKKDAMATRSMPLFLFESVE